MRWCGSTPDARLELNETERLRVQVYGSVDRVLAEFLGDVDVKRHLTIDEDRYRSTMYRICDRILRSEGAVFTAHDLLGGDSAAPPLGGASRETVGGLLVHMAHAKLLEDLGGAARTVIGDTPQPDGFYRLSPELLAQLGALARSSERERAKLFGVVYGAPAHQNITRTRIGPQWSAGVRAPSPTPTLPDAYPMQTPARRDTGAFPAQTYQRPDALQAAGGDEDFTHPIPRELRQLAGGRFELLDVIGAGGMGTVYRARDAARNDIVAIKVLDSPSMRHDPAMRARFEREARLAQRVEASGVVSTHEVLLDEPDGRMAIVMDLVAGDTLAEVLHEGGPLPARTAAHLARGLAETLDAVHALGIIRIDLKPDNIILTAEGRPVIVDLGLARAEDEDRITRTGVHVGTPGYMSPEQVTGLNITARTDLFSLGLILFEMVGGTGSQRGALSLVSAIYRVVNEDIDPADAPCSEQLREIIRTATRRNPDERFADARAMAQALASTPELAAAG